jgi:hypothetical protein
MVKGEGYIKKKKVKIRGRRFVRISPRHWASQHHPYFFFFGSTLGQ